MVFPGSDNDHPLHLVPRSRMRRSYLYPLSPLAPAWYSRKALLLKISYTSEDFLIIQSETNQYLHKMQFLSFLYKQLEDQ
jgi:hypothetical protein